MSDRNLNRRGTEAAIGCAFGLVGVLVVLAAPVVLAAIASALRMMGWA